MWSADCVRFNWPNGVRCTPLTLCRESKCSTIRDTPSTKSTIDDALCIRHRFDGDRSLRICALGPLPFPSLINEQRARESLSALMNKKCSFRTKFRGH